MKRIDSYEQGDGDQLCSIYAIVNGSFRLLPDLSEEKQDALFRSLFRGLCRALHEEGRLLDTLINGMTGVRLESLLDAAVTDLGKKRFAWVSSRLPKGQPLEALRDLVKDAETSVIIIFHRPDGSSHWTVVDKVGRSKFHLLDSNSFGSLPFDQCGFDTTQKPKPEYRISREVFILRRI